MYISRRQQLQRVAEFPDMTLESQRLIDLLTATCIRQSMNQAVSGRRSHTCLQLCKDGKPHMGLCSGCTVQRPFTGELNMPVNPLHSLERVMTVNDMLGFVERIKAATVCLPCSIQIGYSVGHPKEPCLAHKHLCLTCCTWKAAEPHTANCRRWFPTNISVPTCQLCFLPQRVTKKS